MSDRSGRVAFAFISRKDENGEIPKEPTMIGVFVDDTLVATVQYEDMWSVVDFMAEHLPPRSMFMTVS